MKSAIQHIITSEFPPQPGGVSDFTRLVAEGLASRGIKVHVWCPTASAELFDAAGVIIHRDLGSFKPTDLHRLGRKLNSFSGPRQILIQWVPHGFGYRSLNLYFCLWLWKRAILDGDQIQLFIHEPFLAFGQGSFRQDCAASVHRVMVTALLMSAKRVLLSVPGWKAMLKPYTLGREIPFEWSPIPSNIPVAPNAREVMAIRKRSNPMNGLIIGHFGTYGSLITGTLAKCLRVLLSQCNAFSFLLLGRGGTQFRNNMLETNPAWADRIVATGELTPEQLSNYVQACDLMLQPYPDGISSRRTSAMVSLAHGKPVVTTFGHLSEAVWRERNAVALADVNDPAALVRHVERLASDSNERQRLARAGEDLYSEQFAIGHTLAKLGYA